MTHKPQSWCEAAEVRHRWRVDKKARSSDTVQSFSNSKHIQAKRNAKAHYTNTVVCFVNQRKKLHSGNTSLFILHRHQTFQKLAWCRVSCFSFSLIKFARPRCVVYVVTLQNIHRIFVKVLFVFLLLRIPQYASIENKVLVFHVALIQCHIFMTMFPFGVFNRHWWNTIVK